MLVLSRKEGETLVIDHNITITVCKLTNGSVKLGVTAPKNISVNRGEVERGKRLSQSGRTLASNKWTKDNK